MGHPNPGLKHAQNIIRHPGRILPELGRRSLFRHGKPKTRLAHGPAPRFGPFKASLTEDEISASLEGRPSGTLGARMISASLEGRPSGPLGARMNSASIEGRPSGPLDARTDSASLEAPSAEPSTGPRCRRNLRLVRDYPRRTEATVQPPRLAGRIYSPTTPQWGGGGRCQAMSAGVGHRATQRT